MENPVRFSLFDLRYLLFLVLFVAKITSAQQVDIAFFQEGIEKEGERLAPALLPLVVDTSYSHFPTTEFLSVAKEFLFVDSIFFENFYRLKNAADFQHISHLGDTSLQLIQISESYSRLLPILWKNGSPYEKVAEQFIFLDERKALQFSGTRDEQFLSPSNWQLVKQPKTYGVDYKRGVRMPYDGRVEEVPAEYISLLTFNLHHPIKNEQEKRLVEQYCKSSMTYKRKTSHKYYKTNYDIQAIMKANLIQEAGIQQVSVYSVQEIGDRLLALKVRLRELGFYQGKLDDTLDDSFKVALMKYQLAHKFPVGQFEKEGIDFLLTSKNN